MSCDVSSLLCSPTMDVRRDIVRPLYGAFADAAGVGRSSSVDLQMSEQLQLWKCWRAHDPTLDAVVKQCERECKLAPGQASMAYVTTWRPREPLTPQQEAFRAEGVSPTARSFPRMIVGSANFRVADDLKDVTTSASGVINEYIPAVAPRREGKRGAMVDDDVPDSVYAYGNLTAVLLHKAYDRPDAPSMLFAKVRFYAKGRQAAGLQLVVDYPRGENKDQDAENSAPFRLARTILPANVVFLPVHKPAPRRRADDAPEAEPDGERTFVAAPLGSGVIYDVAIGV
jgi:hypothetical protein